MSRPADGLVDPAGRQRVTGGGGDLVGAQQTRRSRIRRVPDGSPARGLVVLVVQLADEFLEDVLGAEQSGGAAVLVDDDRELTAVRFCRVCSTASIGSDSGTSTAGAMTSSTRTCARCASGTDDRLVELDDADDLVEPPAPSGPVTGSREWPRASHGVEHARRSDPIAATVIICGRGVSTSRARRVAEGQRPDERGRRAGRERSGTRRVAARATSAPPASAPTAVRRAPASPKSFRIQVGDAVEAADAGRA